MPRLVNPHRDTHGWCVVSERSYSAPDEELRVRMQVAAQYDAPAFIRRARGVEVAYEQLLERCRRQRAEWLAGVRLHLGFLRAGAKDWHALRPILADDGQIDVLKRLHAEAGEPEHPMTGPTHEAGRRRVLRTLCASVERFNRRWHNYIAALDLSVVNALRDGYNRYYLLEKECAVGPARLLPQLFRRLEPVTAGEMLDRLPPLPVPRAAG
jgi:hypothetical protein